MTVPVVTHPEAEEEIQAARVWYDVISTGLGDGFVARVLESLDRIASNPRLYVDVGGGLHRASVRRFPYHIYYRIGPDFISVLAVFHSHADRRKVIGRAARRVL